MAVCLPEIWEYMIGHMDKCLDKRGKGYLHEIFINIANTMGAKTPLEAVSIFRNMMKQMELSNPVSEHLPSDILLLSSSVNPIRLKNNPIELNEEAIMFLYNKFCIKFGIFIAISFFTPSKLSVFSEVI